MTTHAPSSELRAALLKAGREVFAEHGYAGATVHQLLEQAATSRATFYRYFANKDELFWTLAHDCFRDMHSVMLRIGHVDPGPAGLDELEELMGAYRDLYAQHRGVIRAWFERQSSPRFPLHKEASQVFGAFVQALTAAIETSGGRSSVEPKLRAAMVLIVINRSHEYATSKYSALDADRLAPTLARLIHRAYFGAVGPRVEPVARQRRRERSVSLG